MTPRRLVVGCYLCMLALLAAGCERAESKPMQPVRVATATRPATLDDFVYGDVARPDEAPTYLVVAPRAGLADVLPLAVYRAGHGQSVRIATVEDVTRAYGAAGSGEQSRTATRPSDAMISGAIRRFVDRLRTTPVNSATGDTAQGLKFLLLVGTANASNANGMFLPTIVTPAKFYSETMASEKELAGDYLYGAATTRDGFAPDLAVGRLPARNVDELRTMIAKTLDCEMNRGPGAMVGAASAASSSTTTDPDWRRRVDLFAGQGNYGPAVDRAIETVFGAVVANAVPNYLSVDLAYANPGSIFCYDPAKFSDHMVDKLADGPAMMVYIGHGHDQGFDRVYVGNARYDILSQKAVPAINVPHHRTLVVSIACSTGKFDAAAPSIGERLVASPTGPAAFIGASRISQPYPNAVLGYMLTQTMMNGDGSGLSQATVGEALLATRKLFYEDRPGAYRRMIDLVAMMQLRGDELTAQRADQIVLYNLLGDPALSMPLARTPAKVMAAMTLRPGRAATVNATAPLAAGTAHFTFTAHRDQNLSALLPVDPLTPDAFAAMTATNAKANDKVVTAGDVKLSGAGAEWTFTVPPALPAGTYHINLYAEDGLRDAVASTTVQVERD